MVERLKGTILGGFGFKERNKKSLSLTSRKSFSGKESILKITYYDAKSELE